MADNYSNGVARGFSLNLTEGPRWKKSIGTTVQNSELSFKKKENGEERSPLHRREGN